MDAFTLTDIKKKNLSDIYHYIYKNPDCSKQSIANALAISLPTVSQHLITLMNKGLIQKSGQLVSAVGRRAVSYQILPTAKIAVGIEILARNVYITALNLYGKKEAKEKFQLNFRNDRTYFEELQQLVKDFLEKAGPPGWLPRDLRENPGLHGTFHSTVCGLLLCSLQIPS